MSMTAELREHFKANPDTRYDNAALRDELDIDDGQQISVGLNALHAAGELKREKKDGHGFDYWMPSPGAKSPPAPMVPKDVAVRLVKQRAAAAPASKPPKKDKPQKSGKRKYTRRAPHQQVSIPGPTMALATRPAAATDCVFAIRNDGELGIDNHGNAVSLKRTDAQRLQDFLKTVSPLWS